MRVENHTGKPLVVEHPGGRRETLPPASGRVPGPEPAVVIVVAPDQHSRYMHRLDAVLPTGETSDEDGRPAFSIRAGELDAVAERMDEATGQGVDVGPWS